MYTNKEISESEISKKKIPFDMATRKIKYLGINLTKEVKDLYSENYTTLKKEIKEDTNGSMYHAPVSYTHLTLPTTGSLCRSRWSPYH